MAGYVAYVAPETIRQHHALETRAFDMGIMENVFWNTTHGRFFASSLEGGSHLGVHTSFIFLLLMPLYAAFPCTETLLVAQTLLFALAAWPLSLIARTFFATPLQAALVAGLYLIHPAIGGANFYDFHELAFGPLLFFSAFYFLLEERWRPFWVFLGLLLLVKEDMALVVLLLGVYCLLSRRLRLGVLLVSLGALSYGLLQGVVIPLFAGREHSYAWYYADLIPAGEGPLGLVKTFLSRPAFALAYALQPPKLLFLLQLLAPLGLVCLFSARSLALMSYGLLASLCASRPHLYQLGFQYPLQILPYAFAGALDRVATWKQRFPAFNLRVVLCAWTLASLFVSYRFGMIFPRLHFRSGFRQVCFDHAPEELERYEEVRRVASIIPAEAAVTASETLVPHVAQRRHVQTLRYAAEGSNRDDEYFFILRDELRGQTSTRYKAVLTSYTEAYGGKYTLLLKRPPQPP